MLLVKSSEQISQLLIKQLTKWGATVTYAQTAQKAKQIVQQQIQAETQQTRAQTNDTSTTMEAFPTRPSVDQYAITSPPSHSVTPVGPPFSLFLFDFDLLVGAHADVHNEQHETQTTINEKQSIEHKHQTDTINQQHTTTTAVLPLNDNAPMSRARSQNGITRQIHLETGLQLYQSIHDMLTAHTNSSSDVVNVGVTPSDCPCVLMLSMSSMSTLQHQSRSSLPSTVSLYTTPIKPLKLATTISKAIDKQKQQRMAIGEGTGDVITTNTMPASSSSNPSSVVDSSSAAPPSLLSPGSIVSVPAVLSVSVDFVGSNDISPHSSVPSSINFKQMAQHYPLKYIQNQKQYKPQITQTMRNTNMK